MKYDKINFIIQIVIVVVIGIISIYSVLTENYEFLSYSIICLGLLCILIGFRDFKSGSKALSIFSIAIGAAAFIYGLIKVFIK